MDIADRAQEDEERGRLMEAHLRLRVSGAAPAPALNAVRDCADCGVRLSKRRLLAMPGTTRCVECQEFQERRRP
jgi:phage/conjugal plasmid C-4 type zinc finger TraR family protein